LIRNRDVACYDQKREFGQRIKKGNAASGPRKGMLPVIISRRNAASYDQERERCQYCNDQ
jgi:hypothetical protein